MYPNSFMPYNMFYQVPRMMPFQGTRMIGNGISKGGLFSRLGSAIKGINWTGLINNTSKTLGVINQAIPLVRQTGPMINNMKSMLRVASAFRDETTPRKKRNNNMTSINNNSINNNNINNNKTDISNSNNTINNNTNNLNINDHTQKKDDNNSLPYFFV